MTGDELMPSVVDRKPSLPTGVTSTWDWGSAWLGRKRLCAAACVLAFAGAFAFEGELARVLAALVLIDVAVLSLPWRVPRAARSMRSIWLENLASQAMPLGAVTALLVFGPAWLWHVGSWWWYPVALVLGVAVVAISGLNLRMLFSGELAFLAGPRPRAHAAVHAICAVTGPPGEETVFRGVVFLASGIGAVVMPALAAVAFVARHYLPRQAASRIGARGLVTQVAGAVVMLSLTVASRSLYPAIAAHLINNAPQAFLVVQRGRIGGHA